MTARRFPKPWYVNVRLFVADSADGAQRDGWAQAARRYRTRAAARNEHVRLVALAETDGLETLAVDLWGRIPHRRPPVRATITYGARREYARRTIGLDTAPGRVYR